MRSREIGVAASGASSRSSEIDAKTSSGHWQPRVSRTKRVISLERDGSRQSPPRLRKRKGRASTERARPCWLRLAKPRCRRRHSRDHRPAKAPDATMRVGSEGRTTSREEPRGPYPLGPRVADRQPVSTAGLTRLVRRKARSRQVQFYVLPLHEGENCAAPSSDAGRPAGPGRAVPVMGCGKPGGGSGPGLVRLSAEREAGDAAKRFAPQGRLRMGCHDG